MAAIVRAIQLARLQENFIVIAKICIPLFLTPLIRGGYEAWHARHQGNEWPLAGDGMEL
jgi:hypothetical protein